jgi:hypothetical protein
MGYSSWSDEAYDRVVRSARVNKTADEVFVNKTKIDKSLDPKGVKLREARDSAEHPESNAIGILFDVTGSMGAIPRLFAMEKLPSLMKLLVTRGYIPHPQILFGAIGDAATDSAPLQVGQFESGLEMDDCLTKVYLEGGGGGQTNESYELGLYFMANHTACDCWEKRGKKPYLFTIGDEHAYRKVRSDQVEHVIGDKLEADITLEEMISTVNERFEYFHIAVRSGSYPDGHHSWWKGLLGERALMLEDPTGVCELIGMTIGACEGRDIDDAGKDMEDAGLSKVAVAAAKKAIVPYVNAAGTSLRRGSVSGDLSPVGSGSSKRL